MTVLLYSYKAAFDDGVELKHSLRSVQANLHLGDELKLVLVGDQPPAWCKPDLWVAGNPTGDKVANMAYNVRAALGDLQVITASGTDLGEILYLSDDYFLLDVATSVPTLNAGLLREHVEKCRRDLRAGHWYTVALAQTFQRTLEIQGGPARPLSYELHRPFPLELHSAVDALDEMPQGVFWRTWYGNHAEPVSYPARDGRYVGRSFPMGLSWVSTEESVWASWAGKRLATMFPIPSRWER